MKKEYFLLILVIVSLGAYLFFHSNNKDNYVLPQISQIDKTQVKAIEIIKPLKTIDCFRDNDQWVVTSNKFPGDVDTIQEMIAAIANLKVTTLISENPDLKRYNLDKDKAIKIIAKGKHGILREFNIGKTAPTQRHTFVTLDKSKMVFYAPGNLNRLFDKSIDNIRDKAIQKFDKNNIETLEIKKGKIKRIFSKQVTSVKTDKKPLKEKTQWQSIDNKRIDPAAITSILDTLSDLRCSTYIENQTKKDFKATPSFITIILKEKKDSNKIYKLNIFPKTKQNIYAGISSQNKYVFALEGYIVDNIISNTDKLLNIKKGKK